MDLAGIGTVDAAEGGDLAPLIARLRGSNLSADEIDWIERRLLNPGAAKMRAGPKVTRAKRIRDVEIFLYDAWLRLTGWDKAMARYAEIAQVYDLKHDTVARLIPTIRPTKWELETHGMPIEVMVEMIAAGRAEDCKPVHFRN